MWIQCKERENKGKNEWNDDYNQIYNLQPSVKEWCSATNRISKTIKLTLTACKTYVTQVKMVSAYCEKKLETKLVWKEIRNQTKLKSLWPY